MESEEVQSDVSQEPVASEVHRKTGSQDAPELTMAEPSAQCEAGARQDKGAEVGEKSFVSNLHGFMKERGTPIERIPHLGFKQINLWRIYKAVGNLGGYDSVTARRLWKSVYDDLGGSPGSTSAATCTRRHYERLVLPFDRHLRGETDKPLPHGKPRKQYRRNMEKAGKERGKRKTVRMEKELREAQRITKATVQVEAGTQAYAAPWPISRPLLSCLQTNREPAVVCTAAYDGSRSLCVPLPASQPLSDHMVSPPGMGLSPLEKKKRMAQASLSQPSHLQDDDKDRPSVIHRPLPQATQLPAPECTSFEDSPRPVSTSSSRCSSPHSSLSSEDLPAAAGGKPEPNGATPRQYVTLVSGRSRLVADNMFCSAITKGQVIPFPGTQLLKADAIGNENKDSVWRAVPKVSGRESARTCPKATSSSYFGVHTSWPPAPNSSFTKVLPKPAQPLKPTPLPRGYKIDQGWPTQPHDQSVKKRHHLPPWIYQTSERRDKSKRFLTSEPRPLYAGSQPPPSYLFTDYGRAVRDSMPQPPPLQAFLPERMRTAHSQPLYHQAPVGLSHPAHFYSYPSYYLSAWSDQSEYARAGVSPQSVYPRKL
ncbi:AT-rich interactive domain-containing protein 5A [Gadus macrocephalus]|uniref:AT-rich interactive domain-containing protein 5A n=1 Tax=Gadus macrocephalus TaxID=80720 RepID=UPI0028CB8459|nr:AT-rich interactive domain-containing protein 5A [Gadus macrocephalus]